MKAKRKPVQRDLVPLCPRCEYRAMFLERGYAPRFECQHSLPGTTCCYMYRPVQPLTLTPSETERKGMKRSLALPAILAGRANGYKAPMVLRATMKGLDLTSWWEPKK